MSFALIKKNSLFLNWNQRLEIYYQTVNNSVENLLTLPNYPCVPAVKSFKEKDIRMGIYQNFGKGTSRHEIGHDIRLYLQEWSERPESFLSFWAVFVSTYDRTETEFQEDLWSELSLLTSVDPGLSWSKQVSSNPNDPNFSFSFDQEAFFVVGLHPQSSRKVRTFPYPALVFNVYDQFENIKTKGTYENLVTINRERDRLFQGDVNPMVEKYGEKWEAIQYSGVSNGPDWKCPFRKLK